MYPLRETGDLARQDALALRTGLQVALLGEVTERLLAVTASVDANRDIALIAYFRTRPTSEEIESISEVATEVMAAFTLPEEGSGAPYATVERVEARDVTSIPLEMLDFWAFLHKDAVRLISHTADGR